MAFSMTIYIEHIIDLSSPIDSDLFQTEMFSSTAIFEAEKVGTKI